MDDKRKVILVEEFLSCFNTKQQALKYINDYRNTRYPVNRLYDWLSGYRKIPEPIKDVMRTKVLSKHFHIKQKQKITQLLSIEG